MTLAFPPESRSDQGTLLEGALQLSCIFLNHNLDVVSSRTGVGACATLIGFLSVCGACLCCAFRRRSFPPNTRKRVPTYFGCSGISTCSQAWLSVHCQCGSCVSRHCNSPRTYTWKTAHLKNTKTCTEASTTLTTSYQPDRGSTLNLIWLWINIHLKS